MRFALLTIAVSAAALSVACGVETEQATSSEDAITAGVAAGDFVLHAEANHTIDPECDSFTDLKLVASGRAELSDRLTGRCSLVALYDPNPRAFTITEKPGSCGSKVFEGMRRVALGPATTGVATIKITDHRTRLCKDIVPAQIIVEETTPGPNGVKSTKMFSQRPAGPASSPPSPDFCKDGTIESETGFIDSSDGMSCALPRLHCVTKDWSACPQLSPPSPDFCKDGRVVAEPNWITSADGMECSIPRLHCVTKDVSACPQLSPLFCPNGDLKTEPNFFEAGDGMECSVPRQHCVTRDASACPQL